MKKVLVLCVAVILLVSLVAMPVFAKGPDGQSGSSSTGHVYLYQKNPDWTIMDGGAWGKFNYSLSGPCAETMVSGVFNGKGLQPGVCYALINYIEPAENPWPSGGVPVVCLGTGVANRGGNVNISASGLIGAPDIMPAPDTRTGDKIWLVPCDDLNDDMDMIEAWNQGSILFENALINTPAPCDLTGDWLLSVNGGAYLHDMVIVSQSASGVLAGTGGYPSSGPPYLSGYDWTLTGQLTGNSVTLTITYSNGYTATITGTVAPCCNSMSGGVGTGGVTDWAATRLP